MIEQERAAEARRAVQPAADTEPGTMIYDCSDLAKGRPEVFAVLRAACDAVCKASRATVDVRASDKEAVFTVSGTKGAVARVDDVMKRMFDGLRADPTLAPKAPGR